MFINSNNPTCDRPGYFFFSPRTLIYELLTFLNYLTMIEIKKYRYINENGDGVEISHKIKTLGRIVTLVKRDGYFPSLKTALPEINDSGTTYLYFYPIKGIRRADSSRGFRTFYRVTCRGFDELQYALKKLGYKNYKG